MKIVLWCHLSDFESLKPLRLLRSGLDTQGYSLSGDASNFDIAKYDFEIQQMRETKSKWYSPGWESQGLSWVLRDYKFKGARFVFDWNGGDVSVRINPNYKTSPVVVQLNSIGLHRFGGHDEGHKIVKDFLPQVGINCGNAVEKIYRQDANWDFVVPEVNLDPKYVYAPRRKIRPVMDEELGVETLGVGERGKEHAYLRIYNKTKEIADKGTRWQEPVLKQHGWREGENVVRVELELGGYFLDDFECRQWDSGFLTKLQNIILRLVTESFRIVTPYDRTSHNRSREVVNSPLWDLLVEDARSLSTGKISRVKMPVLGDPRRRARDRILECNVLYRTLCEVAGIDPLLVESDLDFLNRLSADRNLIERKKKRLRWGRRLYLEDGKKDKLK